MSLLPPNYLPEPEKYEDDGKYFKEYAQYVATFYNQQRPRNLEGYWGDRETAVNTGSNVNGIANNPIGNMIRWYQYYIGEQPIDSYWYSYCDEDNNELPTVKIRGQKIAELIMHMCGKSDDLLQSMKYSSRNISPDAESRRIERIEKARFYNAMKQFGLLEIGGIEYSPLSGIDSSQFEAPEKFYEYLDKDFKENFEIVCTRICEALAERNRFQEYFKYVFKQAMIAGVSATEIYVHNGKAKIRGYEPYQVIWDNTNVFDDPQNRKATFVGLVDYLSPAEVIQEFGPELKARGLTEEYETIEKLTTSENLNVLTPIPDSSLKAGGMYNGKPYIAVLRTYFKALEDTRYTETEDKYGNVNIVKLKSDKKKKSKSEKDKEDGDYKWNTWYKCTLIGNIAHVDYGKCENQVENQYDPTEVECPVKVWIPDITLGAPKSMVARLYQHQDRKDWLENEITKMLNLALGKVAIIRGSKVKGSAKVKEIFNDWKRFKVTVLDEDDDDPYNPVDGRSLMDTLDLTLDPNVQAYIQLRLEEDKMMEEIASISKMDLGMQRTYVSLNTQQSTIGQSSLGTRTYFTSFLTHIINVTQHMLNVQKNLIAEYGDDEEMPLLTRLDRELLKEVKDLTSEQIGIYMKSNDIIDEAGRQRIIGLAQAWSQNPVFGVTPADILRVEQSKTWDEAIQYLDYAFKRNERMMAQQQAAQQQQMQEQEDKKLAQERAITAMQEDGKDGREQLKMEGQAANTILKELPKIMTDDQA